RRSHALSLSYYSTPTPSIYSLSLHDALPISLLGLMCIYGIELLEDNIGECRANLLETFTDYLALEVSDDLYRAAAFVLDQNLIQDRKSTRLNSSHVKISYAVFCLKKKNRTRH